MGFPLLPLAARAAVGLGTLAYNAYRLNTTSTEPNMPRPVYARRVAGRRMPMRRTYRRRVYRRAASVSTTKFRRLTTQASYPLVSGVLQRTFDIELGSCDVSDIQNAFDAYRITKVVLEIKPTYDPGAGTTAITNYSIVAANDTTGTTTTAAWTNPRQLSTFENYKYSSIMSGGRFLYTFYPKVTNLVAGTSGAVAAAGNYDVNPWLDFTNVNIPHHRLLTDIRSAAGAPANDNITFTTTVYFECIRRR